MKKFLTLLSAAALTVTAFATVASAAITEDVYKPEWVIEVADVDEEGYAQIDVKIAVDTELAYTVSKGKYTGTALSMTDLILTFDETIFDASDISGDTTSFGGFGTLVYNKVEDVYKVSFLWNNDATLTKQGKEFYHGCFWALLNEDYANKTVDELNAMDFATVVKAGLQIADWAKVTGDLADVNSFYSDGTAKFDCAYRVGAEVVEPDEPTYNKGTAGNEFDGKASKYWTVDFAEWTGAADVSLTDGTTTKTINVTTAEDSEYDIAGAVSFYVYVIGDAAAIENVYIVE